MKVDELVCFILFKRYMDTPNRSKLNLVLQKMVPGTVITSTWLAKQHVSKDLARGYVASGWLERVGHGAYIRSGDSVDWQGAVYALQTQLNLTVHVAGLSALQLKGLGHYLPLGVAESVLLFSDRAERLPDWFSKMNRGVTLDHRSVRLFDFSGDATVSTVDHKGFSLRISSPECAAMEMLYCVKDNAGWDYAWTVFQGLSTLRPTEVQRLLKACRSIQVKRVFLWMAKVCDHPWLKHLDTKDVHLGSGKRVIYKGGMLDKDYQITVPREAEVADV